MSDNINTYEGMPDWWRWICIIVPSGLGMMLIMNAVLGIIVIASWLS